MNDLQYERKLMCNLDCLNVRRKSVDAEISAFGYDRLSLVRRESFRAFSDASARLAELSRALSCLSGKTDIDLRTTMEIVWYEAYLDKETFEDILRDLDETFKSFWALVERRFVLSKLIVRFSKKKKNLEGRIIQKTIRAFTSCPTFCFLNADFSHAKAISFKFNEGGLEITFKNVLINGRCSKIILFLVDGYNVVSVSFLN